MTRTQEGILGAYYVVNLAHRLHDFKICEVYVSWHKIDVPHREVGMEVDDAFHCEFS